MIEGTPAEWIPIREPGPMDAALNSLLAGSTANIPQELIDAAAPETPELALAAILRVCRPRWTEEHCDIAAAGGRAAFLAAVARREPFAQTIAAQMIRYRLERPDDPSEPVIPM